MFIWVVLLLFALLSLLLYQVFVQVFLPAFWKSKIGRRFKKRISMAIRHLFFNLRDEVVEHLITMCEHDGDEPFEPYLDSPLRTCPPCEMIKSPPKESFLVEPNNNPEGIQARRGGRGRVMAQRRGLAVRLPQVI